MAPSAAAEETIRALDTDGSGIIERGEISAFAKSQGLTDADVKDEFDSLDTNGDGMLEPEELAETLAEEVGDVAVEQSPSALPEVDALDEAAPLPIVYKKEAHEHSAVVEEVPEPNKASKEHKQLHPAAGQRDAFVESASEAAEEMDQNYDQLHEVHTEDRASAVSREAERLSDKLGAELDIEDVASNAKVRARRMMAKAFAERAQEALSQRSKDEESAAALEKLAQELRQNASALIKSAASRAEAAAESAAVAAAKKRLVEAKRLDDSAQEVARKAQQRREDAAKAMESARSAEGEISDLVKRLQKQ